MRRYRKSKYLGPKRVLQLLEKCADERLQVSVRQNKPSTGPYPRLITYTLVLLALAATFITTSFAGGVQSKQDEALCGKLNQLPSNASIILICNDDGFRIYSPNGAVRFGNRFGSPWISSSQLLVASISEDHTATETV